MKYGNLLTDRLFFLRIHLRGYWLSYIILTLENIRLMFRVVSGFGSDGDTA